MTSEIELGRIYNELLLRIQHIGIALQGQKRIPVQISESYDLNKTDTPSIGEAEDAFMKWNCAVLTAFRGKDENGNDATLSWNEARNERLKARLRVNNLLFRSVAGCYREAGWDKPSKEICFFVTNAKENTTDENMKDFLCKIYRQAEHYDQDSFLFTFPGSNRVAFLVATSDNGRNDLRGDVRFAGPLFTHVSDIGDWTDCSDGRISFRLKGMILKGGTGNKKIKIGEGDIFDTEVESYSPDGLSVIWDKHQNDTEGHNPQKNACKEYKGDIPLIERYFLKEDLTIDDIKRKVTQSLNDLQKNNCKRIGFHCSACLKGSYVEGARVTFVTIKAWAERNRRRFDQIVIVDSYGDYSKVLNETR